MRLRPALLLLVLAAGGLSTGCGTDSGVLPARVELVHLLPDLGAVSASRDGVPIDPLADGGPWLSFGAASRLLRANPGSGEWRLEAAGPTELATTSVDLAADGRYSLRLIETADGVTLQPVRIDAATTVDQAALRLLHAAPAVGAVDIVFERTPEVLQPAPAPVNLAAELAYGESWPLTDGVHTSAMLLPGSGRLLVYDAGTTDLLLESPLTLDAGTVTNVALVRGTPLVQLVRWTSSTD